MVLKNVFFFLLVLCFSACTFQSYITVKSVQASVVEAPSALSYGLSSKLYYVNEASSNLVATFSGGPGEFSVSPLLPAGLSLDQTTGVISGSPIFPQAAASYIITAKNASGESSISLEISAGGNFAVNSISDSNDLSAGDGLCADSGSFCTLRAAIQEANAIQTNFSVPSKINVIVGGTLTMTLGEISITSSIILNGNNLIVSANNLSRVLNITGANVSLSYLTLRDGTVAGHGGGILYNNGAGTLTLDHMIIRNNTLTTGCCTTYNGGGLNSNGVAVNVSNSQFISNVAGGAGVGNGGAISISSLSFNLSSSLLQSNQAGNRGGGIYTIGGDFTDQFVIQNTHFESNNGGTHAGAIEGWGNQSIKVDSSSFNANAGTTGTIVNLGGPIEISKTTIIGAAGRRAIFVNGIGNSIYVSDSTIIGAPGGGGIVSNSGDPTDLTLLRTIILTTNGNAACGGTMTSLGYNIAHDASCSLSGPGDLPSQVVGNILNSFVPVQDGNTFVLPLKAASPALDTGGIGCGSTDQRGSPRPVNSGGGLFCDIGAWEQQ